jgi:hypothetical protein
MNPALPALRFSFADAIVLVVYLIAVHGDRLVCRTSSAGPRRGDYLLAGRSLTVPFS